MVFSGLLDTPIRIYFFGGVIVMWSLFIEVTNKWIVPPIIRLLNSYGATKKAP